LLAAAFSKFKSSEQPIPISRLNGGLNIAELYHGPTLAFKDLALGVVGQLYDYFLGRAARHVTVLIGTSGDTGRTLYLTYRMNFSLTVDSVTVLQCDSDICRKCCHQRCPRSPVG